MHKNNRTRFFLQLSGRSQTSQSVSTTHPTMHGVGIRTHLAVGIVLLLLFIGAVAQSFWPATDPARYQCYALTFWRGSDAVHLLPQVQCAFLQITQPQAAFHMLPKEYPPFTLLPFSLPLLVPFINYQIVFSFFMVMTILLIYWLLLRFGPRGSAVTCIIFIMLGACALAPMRYDLLPALTTLLCLIAADHKRWTLAYLVLAIGVLLKIYPILLLPALFIAEQQDKGRLARPATDRLPGQPGELGRALRGLFRWQWGNVLLFFAVLIAVTGLFALSDVNNAVVSQFAYFLKRPIQIESLSATPLWLAHLAGLSWNIVYTFGSINMTTALNNSISPIFSLLLILGVLYTLWCQWQRKYSLTQATVALLFVFIATGKVFSPQYLIWLIPLLAYTGASSHAFTYIWGAISLLTTVIYVYFYSQLTNPSHIIVPTGFFATTALRNILFAYLTLAYIFNWYRVREPASKILPTHSDQS